MTFKLRIVLLFLPFFLYHIRGEFKTFSASHRNRKIIIFILLYFMTKSPSNRLSKTDIAFLFLWRGSCLQRISLIRAYLWLKIVKDIFMKLGTNINHNGLCAETKNCISTYNFTKLCPFDFFLRKYCPLYNFNTIKDIFMKLGTNIKDHQTMFSE